MAFVDDGGKAGGGFANQFDGPLGSEAEFPVGFQLLPAALAAELGGLTAEVLDLTQGDAGVTLAPRGGWRTPGPRRGSGG
jgi:hypothetical protein